ncbi:hypothetical protein P691DRAFT_811642 [Macrolepiota fuliginosa MF-IS2]|uniref:Uncharacterized protein n=1 Tax=Macrolepiota fuliginosa MF-IS2 TaxID=1400762 RepID=A0A9P5XGJ7_9AGAR|nr:hypothetical protein P691DRAFT_811642 [Macrolepiota fuliginosa MF-IS2]
MQPFILVPIGAVEAEPQQVQRPPPQPQLGPQHYPPQLGQNRPQRQNPAPQAMPPPPPYRPAGVQAPPPRAPQALPPQGGPQQAQRQRQYMNLPPQPPIQQAAHAEPYGELRPPPVPRILRVARGPQGAVLAHGDPHPDDTFAMPIQYVDDEITAHVAHVNYEARRFFLRMHDQLNRERVEKEHLWRRLREVEAELELLQDQQAAQMDEEEEGEASDEAGY